MRAKEVELNKKINNAVLGDITLVKEVWMDTTDFDSAMTYAEEYAEANNLKLFSVFIGLHNWYTKKTGRYAVFYKA